MFVYTSVTLPSFPETSARSKDLCHAKQQGKKIRAHEARTVRLFPTSPAARRAYHALHVAEVAFERAASRGRKLVLGLGHAPVEVFITGDVLRLFELARVHAQVSVRGVKELFEVVEGERFVDGEGADYGEPDAFVYEAV